MVALYKQVSNQILEQIASGKRKVGDRLPPEKEFASSLGISRSTLRLAFNELESSGVLRRQKKVGTEIIAAEPQLHFVLKTSSIQDMLDTINSTALQLLRVSKIEVNNYSALKAHHHESGDWLRIHALRMLPGESITLCTNYIYVPPRFYNLGSTLEDSDTSIIRKIEGAYNLSVGRIKNKINSISCPSEDAEIMGLETGSPVSQTEMEYFTSDDELLAFVTSIYHPERFQIHSDVSIE